MFKIVILLLIALPCFAKSLLKSEPPQNEFVLYMPDLEKKFEDLLNSKDKCSLESYRKLEQIIVEFYIWMHFQKSLNAIRMLNTMTEKFHSKEGEKNKVYYGLEDILNDKDEVTEERVFQELNSWRKRTCGSLNGIINEFPKN
jgi:hypothetical protein